MEKKKESKGKKGLRKFWVGVKIFIFAVFVAYGFNQIVPALYGIQAEPIYQITTIIMNLLILWLVYYLLFKCKYVTIKNWFRS